MRGLLFSTLAFIVGVIFASGCSVDQLPISSIDTQTSVDQISIASFNIQVFGQSKMDKPEAVKVLVDTVRQYDVIAIQELRSKDQSVVPRFVQLVNAEGANYEAIVGPRLGRTSAKNNTFFCLMQIVLK